MDKAQEFLDKKEEETKNMLYEAWAYCDKHDKSTGFMIQHMQDFANVDFDCVMNFIQNNTEEKRKEWYKSQQQVK